MRKSEMFAWLFGACACEILVAQRDKETGSNTWL